MMFFRPLIIIPATCKSLLHKGLAYFVAPDGAWVVFCSVFYKHNAPNGARLKLEKLI